jgi:hypothetical protein
MKQVFQTDVSNGRFKQVFELTLQSTAYRMGTLERIADMLTTDRRYWPGLC